MGFLAPLLTTYLFQTVMFIASTIMQMVQASAARARQAKMEAEAAARADAAKGVQLTTEGNASALYVCYGRNLIGGNRVYHNTFHSYKHAEKNQDSIIFTSGGFDADIKGTKHEFLYYQQAMCVAGISRVVGITVDGSYLSEPKFKNSIKVQVHPNGGVVDSLMAAQVAIPVPPPIIDKTTDAVVDASTSGYSDSSHSSDVYNSNGGSTDGGYTGSDTSENSGFGVNNDAGTDGGYTGSDTGFA